MKCNSLSLFLMCGLVFALLGATAAHAKLLLRQNDVKIKSSMSDNDKVQRRITRSVGNRRCTGVAKNIMPVFYWIDGKTNFMELASATNLVAMRTKYLTLKKQMAEKSQKKRQKEYDDLEQQLKVKFACQVIPIEDLMIGDFEKSTYFNDKRGKWERGTGLSLIVECNAGYFVYDENGVLQKCVKEHPAMTYFEQSKRYLEAEIEKDWNKLWDMRDELASQVQRILDAPKSGRNSSALSIAEKECDDKALREIAAELRRQRTERNAREAKEALRNLERRQCETNRYSNECQKVTAPKEKLGTQPAL